MNFPPPTPKQAQVLWFALTALAVALLLFLTGALVWGLSLVLSHASGVLLPMALALILAYILDPVVEFFVRKRMRRGLAILLVFFLGFLLVVGLLGSVVPGLIKETQKLVNDLPKSPSELRLRVEDFMTKSPLGRLLSVTWRASQTLVSTSTSHPPAADDAPDHPAGAQSNGAHGVEPSPGVQPESKTNAVELADETRELRKTLNAPFSETLLPALTRLTVIMGSWVTNQLGKVTTWMEFLLGFVLVPVYLFYFLLEKQGINRSWSDYLPLQDSKAKDETVFVLRSINECLIVFFRGQVLVALCVGTLLAGSYLAFGLDYAVVLGVIAGVLGIVPYLGTIVSLALALAVAAVQFGDWAHPLCVLAIAAAVKMLEDLVISPKIIGKRSGLHPLTIILAVMIGTTLLGGFLGALLAIPLTATLRVLMFRYVWKRRPAVIRSGDHGETSAGTIQ